ncbi:histone-fold-containing protein [Aulographum hederae CBS 113979]|uniref:NCT transcriptional regulatory complex subunit B n=1 Tax=Aulographum hederae CBS 113979 TaxID=1176131 RepID=A0A6G1H2B1_9PEZI|nr:histone-fold-containing protein [Aulographum hederae CBS 113979]
MSDREFGGSNDDLSLPKATVQKIISEILANDSGIAFARESRDLLIECCVEFITLISSEANEIADKEAKKTIACEHVTTALEQLGYPDYIPEILKVAQEHKVQQATREKKQNKFNTANMDEDELTRLQAELFRSATEKFSNQPAE